MDVEKVEKIAKEQIIKMIKRELNVKAPARISLKELVEFAAIVAAVTEAEEES